MNHHDNLFIFILAMALTICVLTLVSTAWSAPKPSHMTAVYQIDTHIKQPVEATKVTQTKEEQQTNGFTLE